MKLTYRMRENIAGYMFISPWLLGFFAFTLYPIVYSLYLSFQNVKITTTGIETEAVGFDNFRRAFFLDTNFVTYLLDFLKELLLMVPLIIVFALIIALLLNLKLKLKGMFRTIFFLPVIIMTGPVIEQLIAQKAFELQGLEEYTVIQFISNYASPQVSELLLSFLGNMALMLWYTGVQAVIFLAGLQKIDVQVYEAARIDGASPWETFWKITLQTLKPMILVNLIYTIVTLSTFELNLISAHISTQLFEPTTGFGYASALSWIYFLVLSLVLLVVTGAFTLRERKQGTM